MDLTNVINIIELALGFGFVIFWHELGHFAAAKWAGVKVEQFAIGFGTAAVAWRKGIGFRVGSTRKEYEARTREYLRANADNNAVSSELSRLHTDDERTDFAGKALGLGETEYRLNWLPLGGYVKMLGQDDLNPNAQVTDPRSYNMQPIPKRMVIVSAGVVMNIILAAIGFFVLFLYGFNAPPPLVGRIMPGSPAQLAGLQVGDRIVRLDGVEQHDFTKIVPNVALLGRGEAVPLEIIRADGQKQTLTITPDRAEGNPSGMMQLGISPESLLAGPAKSDKAAVDDIDPKLVSPELLHIGPGDVITHIAGQPVPVANPNADPAATEDLTAANQAYVMFDRAVQASNGAPVEFTVRSSAGQSRKEFIQPRFMKPFAEDTIRFAGMIPRATVVALMKESPAVGKLLPGDIVVSISVVGLADVRSQPTAKALTETLRTAGDNGNAVDIVVERDGKLVDIGPLKPTFKIKGADSHLGLGIAPEPDEAHAIVGGIDKDSAAAKAGIPQGARIVSVNDQPVTSWYDVQRLLLESVQPATATATTNAATASTSRPADGSIRIAFIAPGGASTDLKTAQLALSAVEADKVRSYRYVAEANFAELIAKRHTSNPLVAARWGVQETRDLIVQFYLTIKRMTQGSVPASNLMGPLGIVQAGAKFANRGADWLIWFLAMISANLAVVNFLPIPIVDGGLFVFLVIEKLQGKPLSARTQSIAQVVGLALILSVFIFVTYQDIMR